GLWAQLEGGGSDVATLNEGLLLELPQSGHPMPSESEMPRLPAFCERAPEMPYGTRDLCAGFTLELWLQLDSLEAGQVVLDNRNGFRQGLCLRTTEEETIEIVLNDGRTENRWDCDPGMLKVGRLHHLAVVVDGGPRTISFIVDGKFCDGGEYRQFGWGRFSPRLRSANGGDILRIGSTLKGRIDRLRIYNRSLRTAEIIENQQIGFK
ncbi:MAG: LamG domain-containing protein, partial [Verrucomicrobiota bacterium]